jgi:hypothetical protein
VTQGRRLLALGCVLLVAAAATYGLLRFTYGQRSAYVHVRWAASVDDTGRETLERTYSLTGAEHREGRTWSYFLTDVSRSNIERLITNPAVEDTHNLHRTAFRVWRDAPRGEYPGSGPRWIAVLLEFLVRACLGLGGVALAVGAFRTWRARGTRASS